MTRKPTRRLRCPVCRRRVFRSGAEFPFCSARCRLVDLGRWASGAYVVCTPITDPDALGAAEAATTPKPKDRPPHADA